MWKQYLHIPEARSFITSEWLETSCGVVSSPLEEREDSAEEGCGVPVIISYKSSEDFCRENGACHRYNLSTKVLMPVPSLFFILQGPGHTAPVHLVQAKHTLRSHMFQWEHPIREDIH